ncbi:MAG: GAF domain-containing protein, partial [Spirochaetaceae bacterium]|nr:GAF domain-containing protein [Spirochaetaceae bacterium]
MKKLKQYFLRFSTHNELPFDARILYFVCFLGALAAIVAIIARIIEGMPLITISTMVFIFTIIIGLLLLPLKHSKITSYLKIIVLYGLGLLVCPVVFFTSGGADSGMAAYFVLVIILDFLLLKGAARIGALIVTSAVTILSYIATIFLGWDVLPTGGMNATQRFIDNMQSIFVTGFFLGAVILFQNRLYIEEKNKVLATGAEILCNEKLLTLVNHSATLLLTAEPEMFEVAITESMKKMATYLDFDRAYIWRADEHKGIPIYRQQYSWVSPNADATKTLEAVFGVNWVLRISEWDEILKKYDYISETAEIFSGNVKQQFLATGLKAITAFPVFLHDKYWGFVSFDNCHSEKLCSDREAAILFSGSMLLANAVERNENTLQINEQLAQQQLMSNISKSFITKEPISALIHDALSRMGAFLDVQRVLIAVFEKGSEISRPEYFWIKEPKYMPQPAQKGFSKIIKELFPIYNYEIDDNPTVYCENTLTYEEGKFKLFFECGGQKSFICTPIYVEGNLWGVMSIEEHDYFRHWKESDAILVSTVSSAISNAVARDIMEKERAYALDQAISASHAKSDFLSNMSHEMRTPMNAIIGMTSIGKSAHDTERKDYSFSKIEDASHHLLGVINDILDMSKIEAGKFELLSEEFCFEKMLQRVVNVVNYKIAEKQQKLKIYV